ncbi:MAG: hypothetical protein QHH07_00440 [Sedimentisphaerales bacterium]|nr:hypothetical protein [Sedimentisphaerales bacterium]
MITVEASGYIADHWLVRRRLFLGNCVCWLATIGIVQAWLAAILFAQGLTTGSDQWGNRIVVENKSTPYYLLHGSSLANLLAAGLIAASNSGYQSLDRLGRFAIWLLVLVSILWTIIAYDWPELLSPTIFGATGPFVWLSVIIVFAGMESRVWAWLDRLVDPLVIITAIMAIVSILHQEADSPGAVLRINHYFSLLFWFGGWRCLARTSQKIVWILMDSAVLALLMILALWLMRRSWVINISLLISIYLVTLGRRVGPSAKAAYCVAASSVGLILMLVGTMPSLQQAVAGLIARLDEDTRTGQYRIFFSQVKWEDLILGLGPKATYYYGPASPQYQFFDNAYIWMAFIGGLPILVCYCLVVLWPGLAALFVTPSDKHTILACGIMLAIWALILGGLGVFSCPCLSAYHYLICLMAGLCWSSKGLDADDSGQ